MHKMVQNLGVFVAELQGEGFVRASGPDYALLFRAARTIDRLLETLLCGAMQTPLAGEMPSVTAQAPAFSSVAELPPWNLPANGDTLGYELEFWRMLGEHPSLLGSGDIALGPGWLDDRDVDSAHV
jgi:hypothetical protein